MTYYPVFQNVKKVLAELHYFLTPDVAFKAVFTNVPIIGFKNGRSLKDHLFRAMLAKVDTKGRSRPCAERHSYKVCKSVNDSSQFERRDNNETFDILKDHLIAILVMSFIYLNVNNVNIAYLM